MSLTVPCDDQRPTLTALDRCDACSARAVTVANRGDSTLLFCGHHTYVHTEVLTRLEWTLTTKED